MRAWLCADARRARCPWRRWRRRRRTAGAYPAGRGGGTSASAPAGPHDGPVWGSGPYTADSDICTAAVHAGRPRPRRRPGPRARRAAALDAYPGTVAHGVTTSDWGAYPDAFTFVGAQASDGLAALPAAGRGRGRGGLRLPAAGRGVGRGLGLGALHGRQPLLHGGGPCRRDRARGRRHHRARRAGPGRPTRPAPRTASPPATWGAYGASVDVAAASAAAPPPRARAARSRPSRPRGPSPRAPPTSRRRRPRWQREVVARVGERHAPGRAEGDLRQRRAPGLEHRDAAVGLGREELLDRVAALEERHRLGRRGGAGQERQVVGLAGVHDPPGGARRDAEGGARLLGGLHVRSRSGASPRPPRRPRPPPSRGSRRARRACAASPRARAGRPRPARGRGRRRSPASSTTSTGITGREAADAAARARRRARGSWRSPCRGQTTTEAPSVAGPTRAAEHGEEVAAEAVLVGGQVGRARPCGPRGRPAPRAGRPRRRAASRRRRAGARWAPPSAASGLTWIAAGTLPEAPDIRPSVTSATLRPRSCSTDSVGVSACSSGIPFGLRPLVADDDDHVRGELVRRGRRPSPPPGEWKTRTGASITCRSGATARDLDDRLARAARRAGRARPCGWNGSRRGPQDAVVLGGARGPRPRSARRPRAAARACRAARPSPITVTTSSWRRPASSSSPIMNWRPPAAWKWFTSARPFG